MKFFIFLFLFTSLSYVLHAQKQGKERADSLLTELNAAGFSKKNDTDKVKLLNNLSFAIHDINPNEGLAYANQALKLSKDAGWKKGEGLSYNALYASYSVKGDTQALGYCFKSLEIFKGLGDQKSIAANYGNIADCYNDMGEFDKSLEYETKELKIAEKLDNEKLVADCIYNIGSTYMLLHEYSKANGYFFNSLQKQQKLNNRLGIAQCLGSIANSYFFQDSTATALQYILKADGLFDSLGDKVDLHRCMALTSNIYSVMKQYSRALDIQFKILKMSEGLGNKHALAYDLTGISETYVRIAADSTKKITNKLIPVGKQANLDQALIYVERSNILAKEVGDLQLILENYKNLTDIYEMKKQYDKAFEYLKLCNQIDDTIYNADKAIKNARLGDKIEAELKQKQIELYAVQKNKERNELVFFIVGIGLLLTVIILILDNYNKQKRTNNKLEIANTHLAEEQMKLETTNTHLAEEQIKSDELTTSLKESIIQKDKLAVNLQESLVQKEELATQLTISSNMKSRFLANISHELRTPVTLLTGMLELMKDTGDGGQQLKGRERLEVAYNNSRKLQYMIEEILDLSRLEHKMPELKTEIKEIAPLLRRMVYAFETFIQKTHLSLEFKEENTHGIYILVDEHKLEKIVNNLVYNAVKFNRKNGWIKVGICLSDNKHQLVFSVSNSGSGINSADLPHIFERFYQGDTVTAKAEGLGIGLSLVKEFTVLMGGEVMVKSMEGEATTFMLLFPVTEKTDAAKEAEVEILHPPVEVWGRFPRRHTVLIVEDNAEMRYYLREILGGKVNISESGNGKEALKWLENNKADLVISDIMMPEMDGREFISTLKKTERYRTIPIITLTALADAESQHSLLRMGVDDYIVKPFNATELSIRVYNLLHNLEERNEFSKLPKEPEDIPTENIEAGEFRNKITEYVLARIKNSNVSVYDLAYELHLSERQLYRLAKGLTGYTPAQLIKEVRLQKAYELLASGKINKLEEIANRVGFETPAYFSKQFLERFGKRATEFF